MTKQHNTTTNTTHLAITYPVLAAISLRQSHITLWNNWFKRPRVSLHLSRSSIISKCIYSFFTGKQLNSLKVKAATVLKCIFVNKSMNLSKGNFNINSELWGGEAIPKNFSHLVTIQKLCQTQPSIVTFQVVS